jgi:hypothetical protein
MRGDLRTTVFVTARVQLDSKCECREIQEENEDGCPVVTGEGTEGVRRTRLWASARPSLARIAKFFIEVTSLARSDQLREREPQRLF